MNEQANKRTIEHKLIDDTTTKSTNENKKSTNPLKNNECGKKLTNKNKIDELKKINV